MLTIYLSACQLNYTSQFQGAFKVEQKFIDKTNDFSIHDNLTPKIDAIQFSAFDANKIVEFKDKQQDLLLKITITQPPKDVKELTLTLFPKYFKSVSYFSYSNQHGYSKSVNLHRNKITDDRYFSSQKFAFNIDDSDYLNTHFLLIKSINNRFVQVELNDTNSYIRADAQFSQFFTLIYSIILAMVLFNAIFYIYSRDTSYLLYTLYMLTALYSLLWQEGKINDLPWLAWRTLGDYSGLIYLGLSELFGLLFFYRFMRLNIHSSWLVKIVALCVLFRVGIMLTALVQYHFLDGLQYSELSALFNISIVISSLIVWIIILIKAIQKTPQAWYLLIAWSILILAVLCRIYFSINPHPDLIWMSHSYELAVMIEGLVLAFAMANRNMRFKEQRDLAVSKYNAAEKSIYEHKLITQFQQEMQDLVKDPTLDVAEVKEKTNIKFHLLINKAFPIKNSMLHADGELHGFCTTGLQKIDLELLSFKIKEIFSTNDKNHLGQYHITTSNREEMAFLYLPINNTGNNKTQFIFGLKQNKSMNPRMIKEFQAYCESAYKALVQANELHQVALAANLDGMTDSHNRGSIEQIIRESLKTANRTTLAYIDIDNLKEINDHHGHNIGDQSIIEFARLLNTSIKNHAKIGRVGGDEFIAVFSDVNFETCEELLELFMQLLTKNHISEAQLTITASIGLAESRLNETKQSLIKKADLALYHSKNQGRNQLTIYDSTLEKNN